MKEMAEALSQIVKADSLIRILDGIYTRMSSCETQILLAAWNAAESEVEEIILASCKTRLT